MMRKRELADVDEVKETTLQLVRELRTALDQFETSLTYVDEENGDSHGTG